MGGTISVFVLDDHEVVREGLRTLLGSEGDIEVVGEAGSAEEAMRLIPALQPDVAILDVRLPGRSGVEVCREVRAAHPGIACLILTSFSDDEALLDAVLAGAAGYVLKEVRGSDLVSSVRRVAAGDRLLDAHMTAAALGQVRRRAPEGPDGPLTVQEERILDLIADGLTNRQIADSMHLSEKTVKNYVSNVLAKLGVSRRTEAAVYRVRRRMT